MRPPTAWSIQRYHFYRCRKFTGRQCAVRNRRRENFGKWGGAATLIYGRARRGLSQREFSSVLERRDRGHTGQNVKFMSVTFIVTRTFSRCCCGCIRSRARRPGASGRYFTTESRATAIVLRENEALCLGRRYVRSFHLPPKRARDCRYNLSGFRRLQKLNITACIRSIVYIDQWRNFCSDFRFEKTLRNRDKLFWRIEFR